MSHDLQAYLVGYFSGMPFDDTPMGMNIAHGIFLILLALLGCFFGSQFVLFYAMFMVTDNPAWEMTVPIGIVAVNLISLPLYLRV